MALKVLRDGITANALSPGDNCTFTGEIDS
jgi:hypothetical protein